MTLKRSLLLLILGLLAYLGLYTWNERTSALDSLAENTGLEFVGYILAPCEFVVSEVSGAWSRYLDLLHVREENDELRERLDNATISISQMREQSKELIRLRKLMNFAVPEDWTAVGARVIGTRIGPQGALNSMLLNKGFLSGAMPGTPLVTPSGVVGRVLRSSPHFSTAVSLFDPSCRIAVISQENRFQGIVMGTGPNRPLEVHYVPPNATVNAGEYLVTSGMDGIFPKGIPVAWVESAKPSDTSPFQSITAWPLASFDSLEEVLLLQPVAGRKEPNFNRGRDELPMPPLGSGNATVEPPAVGLGQQRFGQ